VICGQFINVIYSQKKLDLLRILFFYGKPPKNFKILALNFASFRLFSPF